MHTKPAKPTPAAAPLQKCPTGIHGFDEITQGGLPRGRPTLVCGGAGCGKTLFALEFLVHGAVEYGEPGVFIAFEQSEQELATDVASLGFDLPRLIAERKLFIDYVKLGSNPLPGAGEHDLEALLLRIADAVQTVGARRIVLDTMEAPFAHLFHAGSMRGALHRLFDGLKEHDLTAIATAEGSDGSLSRHGIEEHVADCVVALDYRVHEQVATRRLRVVKYRGSLHGALEYPFLIAERGISILPITSAGLHHQAPAELISTGIARLDHMFGGGGVYRGSSVLISGMAGAGKTTVAAHLAGAACRRGERVLYFSFEESPEQLLRNLSAVGMNLRRWCDAGLLSIHCERPMQGGLEMHLVRMHDEIAACKPSLVVLDPITNMDAAGSAVEVRAMLTRIIDWLKMQGITAIFTSLTTAGAPDEQTQAGVSGLMDTWLLLRNLESNGERNRQLCVLKARGLAHSNQVREFTMGEHGIDLLDVYAGTNGVLTGSARVAHLAQERAAECRRNDEILRLRRVLQFRAHEVESLIENIRTRWDSEQEEAIRAIDQLQGQEDQLVQDEAEMAKIRGADALAVVAG